MFDWRLPNIKDIPNDMILVIYKDDYTFDRLDPEQFKIFFDEILAYSYFPSKAICKNTLSYLVLSNKE